MIDFPHQTGALGAGDGAALLIHKQLDGLQQMRLSIPLEPAALGRLLIEKLNDFPVNPILEAGILVGTGWAAFGREGSGFGRAYGRSRGFLKFHKLQQPQNITTF
jgi:hypothetical protein